MGSSKVRFRITKALAEPTDRPTNQQTDMRIPIGKLNGLGKVGTDVRSGEEVNCRRRRIKDSSGVSYKNSFRHYLEGLPSLRGLKRVPEGPPEVP